MKKEIILYTTLGCHLCDQAAEMFNYLLSVEQSINNDFFLKPVEIADSDNLIAEYGIRIPVFRYQKSGVDVEIGWPLDLAQLHEWLNSIR